MKMQLPKLTPLQSRFGASFIASLVLLVLYLTITKPQFAYAVELSSIIPPDHNHPILIDGDEIIGAPETEQKEHSEKILELKSRADGVVLALANNAPLNMNINIGESQIWVFSKETINGPHGDMGSGLPSEDEKMQTSQGPHMELRKRQASRQVYITLNTCLQPSSNGTNKTADESVPPQLKFFVSQKTSNQEPGPDSTDLDQQEIQVNGGYAIANLSAEDDVYIGISAPNTATFNGIWNYEIAASIDAPFHGANESWANLFFVDGDNHAALLITNDTTQAALNSTVYRDWMNIIPPYGMFAHSQDDRSILGVKNSYCGLKNNAQIIANLQGVNNQNVAKMTNRGLGGKPKEQFYITALNPDHKYWGFLAMDGNSTNSGLDVVGGGGMVWAAMEFNTKTENNCALMYNLSFCSEVAYAVPTNPDKFSPVTGLPDLAALYDSNAAKMYQYFNFSLQQIPCNTTSSAQYSLARDCDDCARAYKQWLCAVTIPRCTDFSSTDPWLQSRNVGQRFTNGSTISPQFETEQALVDAVATNSSRNPIIDHDIDPGPYKEVLPCADLCYDLVQSCPAALGFGCPFPGRGLEDSYGTRSNDSGKITCSYLGAAYYLSAAPRGLAVRVSALLVSSLALILFLVL